MYVCKFHEWTVDSAGGSELGELSYLVESHTVTAPGDAANLVARLRQGATLVDDTIANLGIGLAGGRVDVGREAAAGDRAARWRARQAGRELADGDPGLGDAALAGSVAGGRARAPAPRAAPGDRDADPAGAGPLRDVPPRYGAAQARGPIARAWPALPGGDACYRAAIQYHVGLPKTPEELHALGVAEIAQDRSRDRRARQDGARHPGSRGDDREAARRPHAVLRLPRRAARGGPARARPGQGSDPAILLGAAEDRLRDARDPGVRRAVLDDRVLPPAALRRQQARRVLRQYLQARDPAAGSSSRR